jgi:hypothetical protein
MVRPEVKVDPDGVCSSGTSPWLSRAGSPLAARHDSARSPGTSTRHAADCAPRARRPPAMASRATSPLVVAAARAELRWCRCWLRSRLANSVNVSRARSTAWAAAPVMVNRKLLSASEMARLLTHCTTTAPTACSETTRGTTARELSRSRLKDAASVGQSRRWSCDGFGEEGHPALEDLAQLAVGIHRFEQRPLGLVRRVAEPPVHAEHTPIVGGGEDGCVHLELVAQRAEDRVGHLGRVGGRRQCARQRLHALGRLGRHPPPALVAGLRPGRPQLPAALGPQVGDPDGHAGADHQCQHPEQMVELVVLARWGAQDQGEERGVEPDECRAPDAGKGGGDERADGQESDQAELAPEHRVDERHDRDPQKATVVDSNSVRSHLGGAAPVRGSSPSGSATAALPPDSVSWASLFRATLLRLVLHPKCSGGCSAMIYPGKGRTKHQMFTFGPVGNMSRWPIAIAGVPGLGLPMRATEESWAPWSRSFASKNGSTRASR